MKRILASIGLAAIVTLGAPGCSDTDSPSGPASPPVEDVNAPSAITDAVAEFSDETGEVRLRWTAPHDDDPMEPADAYEIRYSYTRGYFPPNFWNLSRPVLDPPDPAAPGAVEDFAFPAPARARDLYIGIRCLDEAGNLSSAGELAHVYVPGFAFRGRCIDVFSREPIAGLDVTVAAGTAHTFQTDLNGEFAIEIDLNGGITHIEITTGDAPATYHALNQAFTLDTDLEHTFNMIPVEDVAPEWSPNLLSLFMDLVDITGVVDGSFTGTTTLAKWRKHPIDCYIPPYINDNGIDYAAQARLAAERWMSRTGTPIFSFVDAPPDTGIVVEYKTRTEMGIHVGITRHTRDDLGHPVNDKIWVVNTATNDEVVYMIFLHEFGHTIPLGHVDDRSFLMWSGQPLPDDISDPEARVVMLHEALPTRIDMSIYSLLDPSDR